MKIYKTKEDIKFKGDVYNIFNFFLQLFPNEKFLNLKKALNFDNAELGSLTELENKDFLFDTIIIENEIILLGFAHKQKDKFIYINTNEALKGTIYTKDYSAFLFNYLTYSQIKFKLKDF